MFSIFKKPNGPSNAHDHAGHSGGNAQGGDCCGGGAHGHQHGGADEQEVQPAGKTDSSPSGGAPVAGENQHTLA
jgi:hypothetical protein